MQGSNRNFTRQLINIRISRNCQAVNQTFIRVRIETTRPIARTGRYITVQGLRRVITIPRVQIINSGARHAFSTHPVFLVKFHIIRKVNFLRGVAQNPRPRLLSSLIMNFSTIKHSHNMPNRNRIGSLMMTMRLLTRIRIHRRYKTQIAHNFISIRGFLNHLLNAHNIQAMNNNRHRSFRSLANLSNVNSTQLNRQQVQPSLRAIMSIRVNLSIASRVRVGGRNSSCIAVPTISIQITKDRGSWQRESLPRVYMVQTMCLAVPRDALEVL